LGWLIPQRILEKQAERNSGGGMMFTNRDPRGLLFSAILLVSLLNATIVLAAAAPMSPAQLALYQGADRDKILIEGAKKKDS
jgi:hypothetical protein